MTLKQTIYDYINNDYAYGKYSEFTIIIMTSNKFINITNICNDYKKDFYDWSKEEHNIELINACNDEINNKSIIEIKNNNNKLINGIYINELLLPHIICWISPKFAIKIYKIIKNHDDELEIKKNKVNELTKKINELKKERTRLKT